jgi:hypothetical protein
MAAKAAAAFAKCPTYFFPIYLFGLAKSKQAAAAIVRTIGREFKTLAVAAPMTLE